MALNKIQLKNEIKSILEDMETRETDSKQEFAERLADAIDSYVRQIDVIYVAGLVAPTGPVTGTFQNTVN